MSKRVKFCGQCGREVPWVVEGDLFCGSCGNELGQQKAGPASVSDGASASRTQIDESPVESRMDSVESVGTKQNRPVAGLIFMCIAFVPLVSAVAGAILPCMGDDWSSYCDSDTPLHWLYGGAVVTVVACVLIRRKFFPEKIARHVANKKRMVEQWEAKKAAKVFKDRFG